MLEPFCCVASPSHDVRGMFCGCLWVAKSFYSLLWGNYASQIVGQTWFECERSQYGVSGVNVSMSCASIDAPSLTVLPRTAASPNSDGRCHGTVTCDIFWLLGGSLANRPPESNNGTSKRISTYQSPGRRVCAATLPPRGDRARLLSCVMRIELSMMEPSGSADVNKALLKLSLEGGE